IYGASCTPFKALDEFYEGIGALAFSKRQSTTLSSARSHRQSPLKRSKFAATPSERIPIDFASTTFHLSALAPNLEIHSASTDEPSEPISAQIPQHSSSMREAKTEDQ
ncbi:MAG: hypothetical protein ACPG7B_15030, partial [Pseudomonadales bacterium]